MKKMRFLDFVAAAILAGGLSLQASAAEVTNASGDAVTGSFRQVLAAAGAGDLITFNADVTTILLNGQANADLAATNLAIVGNDTDGAFNDSVRQLSRTLGARAIRRQMGAFDGDQYAADLHAAIDALPPTLTTFDGSNLPLGDRLVDLPNDPGDHYLQSLSFVNGRMHRQAADHTPITGMADAGIEDDGMVLLFNGAIQNSLAQGNSVSLTAGLAITEDSPLAMANANIYGGAVSAGNLPWVDQSVFTNNGAQALGGTAINRSTGSALATVNAQGGAISMWDGNINRSVFVDNVVDAVGGISESNSGRASASSDAETIGGGAVYMGRGSIRGSIFQGNEAIGRGGTAVNNSTGSMAGADANAVVAGGAVYSYDSVRVRNSVFNGNSVDSMGGSASSQSTFAKVDAQAQADGGALFVENGGRISRSVFAGNSVAAYGGAVDAASNGYYNYGDAMAYGGAVSSNDRLAVNASQFVNNNVTAAGGSVVAGDKAYTMGYAAGGAVALINGGEINNSGFRGNSVQAQGGMNAASNGWANADAYAFGGAVYHESGYLALVDSELVSNSVEATASGNVVQNSEGAYNGIGWSEAKGGAIFVNTSSNSGGILDLVATAGERVLISGNTANGTASGIHFGRGDDLNHQTGYFNGSKWGSLWLTTQENSEILMLDPVTAEMYSNNPDSSVANFAMIFDGSNGGNTVWGGKNVLDVYGKTNEGDNGSAFVIITDNRVRLTRDFTLTTTKNIDYRTGSATDAYTMASQTAPETNKNDLKVGIDSTDLTFDLMRATDTAMFDFSNSTVTGDRFLVDNSTLGVARADRQLFNVRQSYLVADNISEADLNDAVRTDADPTLGFDKEFGVTGFTQVFSGTDDDNQLWVNVDIRSPYDELMRRSANTWSGREVINEIVNARGLDYEYLLDDDTFGWLLDNVENLTPEYAASRMLAARRSVAMLSDLAAYTYFRDYGRRNPSCDPCAPIGCGKKSKYRLWGGYVGQFDRMDSHDGYHGYDNDSHGLIVGGDRKIGNSAWIGIYGGYLNERMRYRGIDSGVDSDGYQLGILAKKTFQKRFSVIGDIAYAHFGNDGYRNLWPVRYSGGFGQDFLSTGLGFEYDIYRGKNRFTPFLRMRYIYGSQGSLNESGDVLDVLNTHVDGLDGNGFTTTLGAEFSRRFVRRGYDFIPRVSLGWAHEYGDVCFDTLASSVFGVPGSGYILRSVGDDRDRFELGLDGRFNFLNKKGREWSVIAAYGLGASEHTNSHMVSVGAEVRF